MYMNLTLLFELVYNSYILAIKILLGIIFFQVSFILGNSKFIVPETLTIDRGEAEVNSQGRGDKKLAIPEYTVYKYFIITKNITINLLFPHTQSISI
jgi:hypothetical protein